MAAKTAHIMLGHGGEILNKKIIVPPGCTLVVEVHSGELNYLKGFDKIFNYNNKKIFLDPINNYKELVDNFANTKRSFAIYEEGSICPEFDYNLTSYWKYNKHNVLKADEIRMRDSGVVSYPFTFIKPKYSNPKDIYKNTDTSDIFIDKYRMSILPTKEQISSAVNKSKSVRLIEVINKIWSKDFTSILHFKQSELFKILPPGVFYNFVCRETSNNVRERALTTVSVVLGINRGDPYTYTYNVERNQLKNSIRLPLKTRTRGHYFAPEISEQISEAEIHRKPYISKLGFNNMNTTKLVAEINFLKSEISRYQEAVRNNNKAINELKTYISIINKKNKLNNINIERTTLFNQYINDYITYISDDLEEIEKIKEELKLKEKELSLLVNNNPINTSTSNYLWEKQNNKWGKITIKNRNNKGTLPEGWKAYSTNNETWYKAPSGKLQWIRPNITYKNKNNKGNLPPGWSLVSDGNAQWYKSSNKVQWTRPEMPIIIHEDPKTPVQNSNIIHEDPKTPNIHEDPKTPNLSQPAWHKPVKAKAKTKKKGFFSSMFA